MRSLRSRLILGSALVAVVPLAAAMYLLSHQVENLVRSQAAERLESTLGSLETRLSSDGARIEDRLRILGRDPVLKRLYLLHPDGSRDLSEYLADRRVLLGLDILALRDTSGTVIADPWGHASGLLGNPRAASPPGRSNEAGLGIQSLRDSSGLAMTASVPIRYEDQPAGFLQGGTVLDAAFLSELKRSTGLDLALRDGQGRIVATTLAGGAAPAVERAGGVRRVHASGRSYLARTFPLPIGSPPFAQVTGMVSTDPADRAIASLQIASALLGALGAGMAVFLGALWSSQISRPVERLAVYSRKLAQGDWDEPLSLPSVRELETLVTALDRMRRDLTSYRDRLLVSERQGAWKEMARKVAHEIKNPLTPIAVSVADLRRSFDQQRADFPQILDQAVRTIAEEVDALKRLLSEFSDFARFPAPELAPCRVSDLLADLEALYSRDIAEGRLAVTRPAEDLTVSADSAQIRQVLVNLIQNGLEAVGGGGRVSVSAEGREGALHLTVSDTGPGLTAEQRARLFTPGFTTKARGSGLGLTIVERIVNDHGGSISVESAPGGTSFRVRLPLTSGA